MSIKCHCLDNLTDRYVGLLLACYQPNVIAYMLESNHLVQQTKAQLAKLPNRVEAARMHQR
jgi:hypothetical protein